MAIRSGYTRRRNFFLRGTLSIANYRGMVRVTRLTTALGARVDGSVHDLLEAANEVLLDLLTEHQVLFVNATTVEPSVLSSLGRKLGPIGNDHHSYRSHPDDPDVVVLSWGGDSKPDAAEWHADMTYREQPPFASVLQAIEVPPAGGDTLWASMCSVYESLSPGLRDELSHLEAVHDMGTFRTPAYRSGGVAEMRAALSRAGTAVHPVIARHPRTGRRYINVSEAFTRYIIGMSAPEAARVLNLVFDAIKSPEHQVRHRWAPGSIAIWDNRGTQHYALADYLPHRRVMHRVAVEEERLIRAGAGPEV